MKNQDNLFAVKSSEAKEFGCPHCGYRSIGWDGSDGRTTSGRCGECGGLVIVCSDELMQSSIGFIGKDEPIYPKVIPHPREGIPSHGRPDNRPAEGGEFFSPRGLGCDYVGCFVCDTERGDHKFLSNFAAFVQCKEAGERVVAMLGKAAWMDYRDFEPDRIQVKVGACERHFPALEKLRNLCSDGRITDERIKEAKGSVT